MRIRSRGGFFRTCQTSQRLSMRQLCSSAPPVVMQLRRLSIVAKDRDCVLLRNAFCAIASGRKTSSTMLLFRFCGMREISIRTEDQPVLGFTPSSATRHSSASEAITASARSTRMNSMRYRRRTNHWNRCAGRLNMPICDVAWMLFRISDGRA